MARVKAAYQMIAELRDTLNGYQDPSQPELPTQTDLAFNQIEATLAVAQATAELASSVDDVQSTLRNMI